MIKGVCFDLFNTLVNVAQVPAHVGRFTADILGVERSDWSRACFGPLHDICRPTSHDETLRTLAHSLDPRIPAALIQQAVSERQQRFDFALRMIEPAVLALLGRLRQRGFKLALISNASTAEVRAWPQSPLQTLFDVVVFSCECGSKKPEPHIYQQALQQLALDAGECIFIGDGGSHEHYGAYQVGMHPVLLTHHLESTAISAIREQQGQYLHAEVASLADVWGVLDGK